MSLQFTPFSTQPLATHAMGRIGLPAPLKELAKRRWDVIIVGGGHNGLTCAAYLAKAGKSVLVLEARELVGGACTLKQPFPGYKVSPCAYLAGLIHPLVIDELQLAENGYRWTAADGGYFFPFEDDSSVLFYDDDDACEAEVARFAPQDLSGWRAYKALFAKVRDALRPESPADIWIGSAPTRQQIADRLAHDPIALKLLFEWSINDLAEYFFSSEKMQLTLLGQGVIGTKASPFDPGTAYIHFHHNSGRMQGMPGTWGYVDGGMGMFSFILCDIARNAGAVIATDTPVARILPAEGVELVSGERLYGKTIISNADPRTTLRLLGSQADSAWAQQVQAIPMEGCTVKFNLGLAELPNFRARPGTNQPHHRGQINLPMSKQQWRDNFAALQDGKLPERLWCELYFQSAFDRSVVPPGKHVMSAFCQYVPYTFAEGDWDSRRAEVVKLGLDTLARFASNFPDVVEHIEVLGPPDIESEIGLSGGHIFHGECLPQHMWENRLSAQTPMPGLLLCGVGTHPGGSVIGIHGRNAAMLALQQEHTRHA
ncbi:MAG TPA: NAD(P)/FAD-dependent oxidoreductase [Anaerolineales bacterium]|nr:NAD(P)/FAD-dependent oxidoreductase [Anaerolineales bacterium]